MTWLGPRFEWAVIAFGIGIGVYFALPFEPAPKALWGLIGFLAGLVGIAVRAGSDRIDIIGLIFIAVLGIGRATWHTSAADTPRLPSYERSYNVIGWIRAIDVSGKRSRWLVEVTAIENLETERTPARVRVTGFDNRFRVGDRVNFRAAIKAPPSPAIAGGYNPARRAYFQRTGGYGYMVSKPVSTEPSDIGVKSQLVKRVSRFRYAMAERIRQAAPSDTAGLQVALLTGIRSWVPDTQTDALRAGGLAHILAISGLHMGLVAGGIYSLATFLLAGFYQLSSRLDIRKPAAVIGIVSATLYLFLSGASVATQRAFIMTVIVFMAVILERRALSIRSVAVAALLTLGFHPESLLSPGFQMSFAAVTALVVVYRAWDARRVYTGPKKWMGRMIDHFKALTVTSIVAGGATAGFAVLHFNRIATYSLLGNLFAMPIFTFWVMPSALLSYAAMPFGLEAAPLWIMGQGIDLILIVSEWVQGLPYAVKYMPSGPGWVMGLFGLAFTGLCLGRSPVKFVSIAAMFLCWGVLIFRMHPDIRLAENGAVAIWDEGDSPKLYVDRRNSDRFGRRQFIEDMGMETIETETYEGSLAKCDDLGCVLTIKDKVIKILTDPTEIIENCSETDLIIIPKRRLGSRARRLCKARIFDQSDLQKYGAHNLYLSSDDIRVKTARKAYPSRPWQKGQ